MMTPVLILIAAVIVLDQLARVTGVYAEVDTRWPAGWRAVRLATKVVEGPYRQGDCVRWEGVVSAGIPRPVSLACVAATGLALWWSLGVVLAVGDGVEVVRGVRPAGAALASFALCVARASAQWLLVDAALGRRSDRFATAVCAALGMDLLLATVPIPCSDKRADDVVLALVGVGLDLCVALALAYSAMRRRGLVTRTDEVAAPLAN